MADTDPHIRAEKRGCLGLLTLARPQALNALSLEMVQGLSAALADWAADPDVAVVAIRGEGRGFCAGGDIRALATQSHEEGMALLAEEYRLNLQIGTYPKPYIALLHGITMGGGAGVSVHGRYRLADPSLVFAMPEAGIGFFTDVGGSYFLPRCPGHFGFYLGLTGARISLGDALWASLATHAVDAARFDALLADLADGRPPDAAIATQAQSPPQANLAEERKRISVLFSAPSVEAILERCERDGSAFAREAAAAMRRNAPTALKNIFHLLTAGAQMTLEQCLEQELRLADSVIAGHDFREGVRAALIDKDRNPRWNPASLAVLRSSPP